MTDRDDVDPADWLAQQFGEEPEQPVEPAPSTEPAWPAVPVEPVTPPVAPPPIAPPAIVPPPIAPPAIVPPPIAPPVIVPPATIDPQGPAQGAAPAPFQWGLTPGQEPAAPAPEPTLPPVPPVVPPTPVPPVASPIPPTVPVAPPVAPADVPTQAFAYTDLPAPTGPAQPAQADAPPAPSHELDTVAFDVSAWTTAPVDPALEGVTEVIEAELVGLPTPEGEGVAATAIDNLFGDAQFQEYEEQSLVVLPPRSAPPSGPRPPMGKTQKILLWVAGGLLAVLALVALFLVGKSLADSLGAAPAVVESATPSPTPTPTSTVLPVGPVEPGEYAWNELLGGECLKPWESAWQDSYVVVACSTPHAAQMVFRGLFDDAPGAAFPGVEELQKRINLLCTPVTVIDYSKAGLVTDIQVSASFAADADEWNEGNRTFFCFVNRSSGQELTESVAVAQVAPAPAP